MDKLAQRRSLRSKVWEKINIPGKAIEKIHPEVGEVMETMRGIDAEIRIAAEDVKSLIRAAKSSFRRRDYLTAAYNIAGFHSRVKHISYVLEKFVKNLNIKHHRYLLEQIESPQREELFNYDPRAQAKIAKRVALVLQKEAGVFDWLKDKSDIVSDVATNIFTGKGRARRLLEQRFSSSFLKETQTLTEDLVNKSEKMLNDLLSIFEELETGISRRNIPLYEKKAKELVSKFKNYDKVYLTYHNKILVPLKAQQDIIATEEKTKAEETTKQQEELARKKEEETARQLEELKKKKEQEEQEEARKIEQKRKETEEYLKYKEPSFQEWKAKQKPTEQEKIQTLESLEKKHEENEQKNAFNQIFIDRIVKCADANQAIPLMQEILRFSFIIEDVDPNVSDQLLVLAQRISDDYKSAGVFDWLKVKQPEEGKASEEVEEKKSPIKPSIPKPPPPLPVKQKPQELIEHRQQLTKPKKLEIPEGRIDKAYTDIPLLAAIPASRIRLSPDTTRMLIEAFAKRIINVLNLDDFEPYFDDMERNIASTLKQAVYDGWVISSQDAHDLNHPRDRYLEIYTRLDLSKLSSQLKGVAKLHISCRVSADQNTLTVRNVKRNFTIEAIKLTTPKEEEEIEEYEEAEQDYPEYDYPEYE